MVSLKQLLEKHETKTNELTEIEMQIMAAASSAKSRVKSNYHEVGFFYDSNSLKFYIKNNDGHKTALHWSDFPKVIEDLQEIEKRINEKLPDKKEPEKGIKKWA